jgi:hypothetical protein
MADIEIVGSHLKSQRGRGMNQDQTGSFTREKSLPIIPNVAPPNPVTANANAKDDDARLAEITGKPIKAHDSMRHRGVDDTGSPSGTVPTGGNTHTAKR